MFFCSNNIYAKKIVFKGLEKLSISDLAALTPYDLKRDNLSIDEINNIMNDFYKSNLIYDLTFTETSETFILDLKENSIIQNIFIINNLWLNDSVIEDNLKSKINNFVSKSDIANDIKIINSLYKSQGFKNASTNVKIEYYSDKRINLIFEVYEGNRSDIHDINFIGNVNFSDKFLSSKIISKSKNFYNFFQSGSNLSEDVFNYDINRLEKFYKDKGFLDVKLTYSLEKNNLGAYSLNFFIKEGNRYKIRNIDFDKDLSNFYFFDENLKKFKKELLKNDNYFELSIFENFLQFTNIDLVDYNTDYYLNYDFSLLENEIDITFNLIKQKPISIDKIDIYGNSITKDKTIRSKILIEPGDRFNNFFIDYSLANLRKQPYIKDVQYEFVSENNVNNLSFTIDEEKKTGNVLFAGTYDADTQLGFSFGIEDKNFIGSGNTLDANFNINSENAKFNIAYTDFPLFNPYLSNTYSFYNQEDDLISSFGYKLIKQGLGYQFNFADNQSVKYGIGVSYSYTKGHSPVNNSSSFITDNIGEFNNILFSFIATKDSTNDIFNPTDGFLNSISLSISPNEISDDPFLKLILVNKNYFKFKESNNFIFFNNNFGYADSLNSKLKTINAFSLGGNNFKGFDFRGIGPISNEIYLGGNQFITSTIGYGSSFLFDEKDNINIKFFLTSGSLWGSDYASYNDFKLRQSLGLSLDFITAIGPISFSLAKPVTKELNDKDRTFSFSIGTSF